MAKTRKRGLALLMAVVLALSLLPVSALASGEDETTHEALTLAVGDKETLVPYAEEASGRWYVEDGKEDVVSVDENGVIRAEGEGRANVYFEYTEEVPVTLEELPEEVPAVAVPETPAVDEPVVDAPAVDAPAADAPVVDAPVVDEPVVDEPVVDEPVVDAPAVDAPVVDAPVVDAPAADDSDDSTADAPVVEEIMPLVSSQYSGGNTNVEIFPVEVVELGEGETVLLGESLRLTSSYFGKAGDQKKVLEVVVQDTSGKELSKETYEVFTVAGNNIPASGLFNVFDYYIDLMVKPQSGYKIVSTYPEMDENNRVRIVYDKLTNYLGGQEERELIVTVEENIDTEYDVTFIWNTDEFGGIGAKNGNEVYHEVQVPAGETIGDLMPVDPVYYNLYFRGWNTGENGEGIAVNADTAIRSDLTVYGQWDQVTVVTEYHVMELDTKVDAYIRAALDLNEGDSYKIREMQVADNNRFTDSDDRWAENSGQAYWYILNAGGLVWEGSGLVWPELMTRVEISVEVNGNTKEVEIPRKDFDLVRLSEKEAKAHIVEIYLRDDSIPQPPVEEKTGTLMVGKSVAGLSSYVGVPADYSVTITVTAEGKTEPIRTLDSSNAHPGVNGRVLQWELKELPVGTYTVTETYSPDIVDKDGNIYKADASKAQITNNGSITVTEDAVVWANVTNTYEKSGETTDPPGEKKTGTLMVGKSVAGLSSYVGVPADYSVTITVTAKGEKYPIYTLTRIGSHPGVDGRVLQWELREMPVGTYIVEETYSPDIVDKDGNVYKADASKAQITNGGVITVTEDAVVWANVTNTYEKSDGETEPPVTPASLSLTKSVDKTYANPGDEVTYTVYVRNSGTTAAEDVTVTDTLNSYLTFVSGSEGVSAQGQEISWTGDVAGKSVVSFQVTARISADTPVNTFITNRAYVGKTASNEVWTKVEEKTEIPDGKVELKFRYVTDVFNASAVPDGATPPETVQLDKGSAFGAHDYGTGDYDSGYTFHGWFANPACDEPMEEDSVLTQDTVVYGYWTYSSGNSGGGSGSGDGDGDGGSTNIPDVDVPTTDVPDAGVPTTDVPGESGTELGDGDVPLAEVPKTGDSSALWVLAAAVSGIGLVWLTVCKKRESEQ